MVVRFTLLLIAIFLSNPAHGEVTLTQINSGFSSVEGKLLGEVNASTNTVYGGLGGSVACTGSSNSSTCNSCNSSNTDQCNSKRIWDGLYLFVTIKTTQAGNVMVTNDSDDNQEELSYIAGGGLYSGSSRYYVAANSEFLVGIPWTEVCAEIISEGTVSSCETLPNDTSDIERIRVGVDSGSTAGSTGDNKLSTGEYATELQIGVIKPSTTAVAQCKQGVAPASSSTVCNFIAYPGDNKVFIEDVRVGCSFSSDYESVRIYFSEDAANHPGLDEINFKDLEIGNINSDCSETKVISLLENTIEDKVSNEKNYRFSAAVIDKAQNVSALYQPSTAVASSSANCYTPQTPTTENPEYNCHYAAPEEVIGMLEDEFDCFITTAAYGSPFKPKVKTFRQFRNRYLKTNMLGRFIIDSYYKLSPSIADWIRNHPSSKAYVRAALYPLWLLASLSLNYPLMALLCLISIGLLVFRKSFKGVNS